MPSHQKYEPRAVSRTVPASGHVAGLVARLDEERGPASTPANATLLDAVDLDSRNDGRC